MSSEGIDADIKRQADAEYIAWLQLEAKEIAATLKRLAPDRIKAIISAYAGFIKRPASMHAPLDHEERALVEELVGKERLQKIILVKSRAIIFAPSILAPQTGLLDYGTAMYRRFFLHGRWVSVIAVNEVYLRLATKPMLRYMLEHELAQGEIYADLARERIEALSREQKGLIHEEARMNAIQWSCISSEEVEQERQLIIELSTQYPLVPVHFASASLFRYLAANWDDVKDSGTPSQNEAEQELELTLEQLSEWAEFAIKTFTIFFKELKRELTMTGVEYGVGIV
jgi:hypothetical protein